MARPGRPRSGSWPATSLAVPNAPAIASSAQAASVGVPRSCVPFRQHDPKVILRSAPCQGKPNRARGVPDKSGKGLPTCPVKGQEAVTALFPREVICYILMLAYSMTCLCFVRAVAFVIGCSLSAYIWRRAVVCPPEARRIPDTREARTALGQDF